MGVLGAPLDEPVHSHTPEQKANLRAWRLEGFDVNNVATAVLAKDNWYHHDGAYGGKVEPVKNADYTEGAGYIANMNDEQPIGVFNAEKDVDPKAAASSMKICCSLKICGVTAIEIYL